MNNTRIAVLLLPGLGDAITAGPMLRQVRSKRPEWALDAIVMFGAVEEYAKAIDVFANVVHLRLLTLSPFAALRALWPLRKLYDVVLIPFPSPRWHYQVVARILAPKRVVTHDYPDFATRLVQGFSTSRVPISGTHRVEENLNLLPSLGLTRPEPAIEYVQIETWTSRKPSSSYIIHVGSMRYKGNEVRRWPLEQFARLIGELISQGKHVRVIRGPQEIADVAELRAMLGPDAFDVIEGSLSDVARAISECRLLIANDSGMAHVAASVGTPSIVLFGMSKPHKALPLGNNVAVRPSECPPCFDETSRGFFCVREIDFRCIRQDLRVSHVLDAIALVEANLQGAKAP